MKKTSLLVFLLAIMFNVFKASAAPINIVAAENFYGQLAKEIGGKEVNVKSIINNPDADPHLFTTSASTSKSLSQAQIIIYSGADYDSWMDQMLADIDKSKVIIIKVADLSGVKSGQNPHLWYKLDTFPKLAKVLADKIKQINPNTGNQINNNLNTFLAGNAKVIKLIDSAKSKYTGTAVIATEPVFGYMTDALGLKMRGLDFQWKIMNDTEPTPKMIAEYQDLLINKQVKVLFYNSQVTDSITKNMQNLAIKNNIPVVGVTETIPLNTSINKWLNDEVSATITALDKK